MGNSSSMPQDPALSDASMAAEFRLSPCQMAPRARPATYPPVSAESVTEVKQPTTLQRTAYWTPENPASTRKSKAVSPEYTAPKLDMNNIPLLHPGEDSDPEHSPVLSISSESRFETANPSRIVKVVHTSPSLSHRGLFANDEFEFAPASRSRNSHRTQHSISAQSIRSWSSMSARSRSPDRSDTADLVNAGVPPRVPPHRILSGKLVRTPTKLQSDDDNFKDTFALPTGDASALPVRVYTRKCSIHGSSSPELDNRLSRQSWPSLTQDSETDETSSMLSEEQEVTRFILDGYTPGSPLKVVNDDEFEPPRKFFVKSKAMLAEEAERKLQRPITAAYGYV